MARIRVGFAQTTRHMVGMLPTPKFTDQERTQIAKDRDTGESLYTVTVFVMEDERAEAIKVTVPKSGLSNGLKSACSSGPWTCSPRRGPESSTARSRTASPTGPPHSNCRAARCPLPGALLKTSLSGPAPAPSSSRAFASAQRPPLGLTAERKELRWST